LRYLGVSPHNPSQKSAGVLWAPTIKYGRRKGIARRLGRLKAAEISRLGPGRHHDGGGLYLNVGKGLARSWIFRFRRDGKLHDYGLGPVHSVSLSAARQRAFECRAALYAGNNPVEVRQARRLERVLAAATAVTFENAAEQYIAAHAAGWRSPRQEAQWRQSLTDFAFPTLGKLPVLAIDTALVLRVLEPIWQTKTETASRVRGRIEAVLDWAAARGFRQGENPARWRGHLENLLPKRSKVRRVEHHATLPFTGIGPLMAELRRQEGVAARALEFLVLTASRTGEVLGARWSEINLAERAWTIPAERMKGGKEHRVPMSDAALQVIEAMASVARMLASPAVVQVDEYVFPGRNGPLGPMALRRVLGCLGRTDISVHGFRSTFRDWAAEVTAYPREVAEMALAHAVGSQVETAYRRGDLFEKRRALMRDWALHCRHGGTAASGPVTGLCSVPLLPRKVTHR
jgi:integrase